MFTVCPKCALTLVVTAADLRVAQGYVRCGRCLNVFNALARLSEERPAATSEPPPDATPDAAPEPPEAATAPQPPAPLAPPQAPTPPPQPEFTQPPTQSSPLDDTGEIEIELDPSIFVTAVRPPVPQESIAEPDPEPPLQPPPAASPETAASPHVATTTPIAVPEAPPPDPAVVLEPEQTESSSFPEASDAPQTNTVRQLPESAFEVAGLRPRAGLAWRVGAGALALVLALQIVNHYRDALAANPALRGPLSTVYSALGVKLAPHWNIHEYDVRQLGASVSGAAAGEIVVRASVKNSASRPQPLPLLRVTLQDRFGNRIAARDVPPGDYLPASVAPSSLLAAGSRVDATMVFVDPGPQAVGFEIDACLRQRSGAVACAHEGP